ncbi:hypothetical protein A6R68_16709, partial [Neotoma lepida]
VSTRSLLGEIAGCTQRGFDFVANSNKAECLFTLEAHSREQKKRVCWCLSENIAKQQQLAASPLVRKKLHPYGSFHQEMGAVTSFSATQDRSYTSSEQTLIG